MDWTAVLKGSAEQDARMLAATLDDALNRCYPVKWRKRKTTDKPWITPHILKRIKSRKRTYKKEERSHYWKTKKSITDGLIRDGKKEYYEKFTNLAKQTGDSGLYFKMIGRLSSDGNGGDFDIRKLYEGRTDSEIAEEAADFFTSINSSFEPLQ